MKLSLYQEASRALLIATCFVALSACKEPTPSPLEITSFKLEWKNNQPALGRDVVGEIDERAKTITLEVPLLTSLKALKPTMTIKGELVLPASGDARDFTNPVQYTVSAKGVKSETYTVTVKRAPQATYRVSFDSRGGSPVPFQDVKESEKLKYPPEPTLKDKTFFGWWYYEGGRERFDFSTPITGPLVLYAKWIDGLDGLSTLGKVPTAKELQKYDPLVQAAFAYAKPESKLTFLYVKEGGSGTQDGTSWGKASPSLKDQLDKTATPPNNSSPDHTYVILVAGGTYDAKATMALRSNVIVIGGWARSGGWTRPAADQTILSGGGTHGVFNNIGVDRTAVLCGVTVQEGNAPKGGGMYNSPSSPTIIGVTFYKNRAQQGGAVYNQASSVSTAQEQTSPTFINVAFEDNTATGEGGAMYNDQTVPTLVSATFSHNNSDLKGGAVYSSRSRLNVVGATFSENTAPEGPALYLDNNEAETTAPQKTGAFIVNSIFWDAIPKKLIYVKATGSSNETITMHNSVLQGGFGQLASAPAQTAANIQDQGAFEIENGTEPNLNLFYSDARVTNPGLGSSTAFEGWTKVLPIAAGAAADLGLYVRRAYEISGSNGIYQLYYSKDGNSWYTSLGANGLSNLSIPGLPSAPILVEDFTVRDARGYKRPNSPDAGAYEINAVPYY